MTPIKCFRRLGNLIGVEDWAGFRTAVAMAASEEQADWLADSLARQHHVPVLGWEEEYRG